MTFRVKVLGVGHSAQPERSPKRKGPRPVNVVDAEGILALQGQY
jgi:hypothetical protein